MTLKLSNSQDTKCSASLGNSRNPDGSPFSQLLGNVALLTACWPLLCLPLPRVESVRPLVGEAVFPNPHLHCSITFDLESLFGEQGSIVTLKDTGSYDRPSYLSKVQVK